MHGNFYFKKYRVKLTKIKVAKYNLYYINKKILYVIQAASQYSQFFYYIRLT